VSTPSIIGKAGKFNISFRKVTLSRRAGLVLFQTFVDKLEVAPLLNTELQIKQRARGYAESEAVLGLVHNLAAGGSCLLDLEVLRGDPGTQQLLGVSRLLAPTTAGEFLRKFDIGDIHDLRRVNQLLQARLRPLQAVESCTLDLDSSIYEQASDHKEGSNQAYNGQIGYHPLFAFWEETGELVFSHLRRGSAHTGRNAEWFLGATLKCVPAALPKKLRADSGFYSRTVVEFCERHHLTFGITADQTAPLLKAVEALPETAWLDLEPYDVRQVAELRYRPVRWRQTYRYIVKRELREDKQGQLYFQYHIFVTNDAHTARLTLLEWHLQHANMENRIKEHKSGFSLEKLPTRCFHANWAYLLIGQLAFNLVAWFKRLVLPAAYHHATAKTIRHQLFNVAGKIVHTARQFFLVLSDEYRYQEVWQFALKQLASLHVA
jgi:hypothetical protein